MRTQVRSLPPLRELTIWYCRELWYRLQMQLGSHVAVAVHRPAAAALIQPLTWEPPYAVGVALKKKKKKDCLFQGRVQRRVGQIRWLGEASMVSEEVRRKVTTGSQGKIGEMLKLKCAHAPTTHTVS